MPLSPAAANAKAAELLKDGTAEWARLRRFVRYARGRTKRPWLPDNAETEYRDIAEKSASNWLALVISATAEGLIVDSYGDVSDDTSPETESAVWRDGWQANGMDARQHALHRAVLTLGYSFLFVFPGDDDASVWMRPDAATKVVSEWDDPNSDEWPLTVVREVRKDRLYELYDDEARYVITGRPGTGAVSVVEHDLEVCPVTRMLGSIDLLGTPMGEVEPVIPIQDRIVDATFTLQMVAKYGAFPQRWIAGIDTSKPLTDSDGNVLTDSDGNPLFPTIKAYIDHILTAVDADTKFGQFAAADLGQYVEALEAHIRHLAAITQTPPHYLLGSLVNLSAEALAAAESGLQRKIREKREVLGEGYEQALRLAARVLGDDVAAEDLTSQVHWQDVESRSLAQTADALSKLKDLGVPPEMLFEMIPGWTKTDATRAADLLRDGDSIANLLTELAAGQTSPTDSGGVT